MSLQCNVGVFFLYRFLLHIPSLPSSEQPHWVWTLKWGVASVFSSSLSGFASTCNQLFQMNDWNFILSSCSLKTNEEEWGLLKSPEVYVHHNLSLVALVMRLLSPFTAALAQYSNKMYYKCLHVEIYVLWRWKIIIARPFDLFMFQPPSSPFECGSVGCNVILCNHFLTLINHMRFVLTSVQFRTFWWASLKVISVFQGSKSRLFSKVFRQIVEKLLKSY